MPKTIVTAAITGAIHTPSMSPYLPVTPEQIAEHAIGAYEAGAAVAHVHIRNPETGRPSSDMDIFRDVLARIKSKCNIIVCTTTGGGLGMTTSERLKVVPTFKPELASFNGGSVNFGLFDIPERMKIETWKQPWELEYLRMTEDFIFANTFKSLREFAQTFEEYNTRPELEVYDVGMINNLLYLVQKGYLKKPVYLQFVMGVMGAIQPSVQNLVFLYETAKHAFGDDLVWSVCVAGRAQIPICSAALAMGGNVRVGLEDSLYLGKGVLAKNSAEQVEKIIGIARAMSIETATPDEAREILGLKGLDKVGY